MRRIPIALLVLVPLALGLAACGGGDATSADPPASASATAPVAAEDDGDADEDATAPASTGPADERIQVSAPADGTLVFDQKGLKAKAGTVELDFDNPSPVSHNVCVRSASGDELGCSEDVTQGSSTLTVDLQPGRYTLYCGEPGHEEGGMAIPLTVS